jgi:hypothetical protein
MCSTGASTLDYILTEGAKSLMTVSGAVVLRVEDTRQVNRRSLNGLPEVASTVLLVWCFRLYHSRPCPLNAVTELALFDLAASCFGSYHYWPYSMEVSFHQHLVPVGEISPQILPPSLEEEVSLVSTTLPIDHGQHFLVSCLCFQRLETSFSYPGATTFVV